MHEKKKTSRHHTGCQQACVQSDLDISEGEMIIIAYCNGENKTDSDMILHNSLEYFGRSIAQCCLLFTTHTRNPHFFKNTAQLLTKAASV